MNTVIHWPPAVTCQFFLERVEIAGPLLPATSVSAVPWRYHLPADRTKGNMMRSISHGTLTAHQSDPTEGPTTVVSPKTA